MKKEKYEKRRCYLLTKAYYSIPELSADTALGM